MLTQTNNEGKKEILIGTKITQEWFVLLCELAKKEERSKASIIREAVKLHLTAKMGGSK